mgnify:CR=1 FL=1
MPQYQLGNNIYEEKDVVKFAKKSNLSIQQYIDNPVWKGQLKKIPVDVSKKETSEDIRATIKNIHNSVTKYDPDVNKELGKILYEDPLKKLERPFSETKAMRGGKSFPIPGISVIPYFKGLEYDYKNDLEVDQENYFGKEKYDQYKKYKSSDIVDLNNVSDKDLYTAIYNVKQRKKKDYITDIDNQKLREQALWDEQNNIYDIYTPLKTPENSTTLHNVTLDLNGVIFSYDTDGVIDKNTTGEDHFMDLHREAVKKDNQNLRYPYLHDEITRKQLVMQAEKLKSQGNSAQAAMMEMEASRRGSVRKAEKKIFAGLGETDKVLKLWSDHNTTIYKQAVNNVVLDKENYETVMTKTTGAALKLKTKAEKLDKTNPEKYNKNLELIIQELKSIENFQVSTTNAYNYQVNELNLIGDKYMDIQSGMNDFDEVVKSLMLNYDFGTRAGVSFEIGVLETLNFVTGLLEVAEDAFYDVASLKVKGHQMDDETQATMNTPFGDLNRSMLDYTQSVKEYKEVAFPVSYRWEDMNSSNYGEALSEVLANNSFSIAAALTYGGVVRYGGKLITTPQATKYLGNTFLAVETGGYFSRQDMAKKNAAENINFADNMLAQEDITPEKVMFAQELKDDATRVLTQGEYEKAFAGLAYGTVAKYFEKFGTMRYVRNFAAANKATGSTVTKFMKGTYNVGFNAATEYVEESGTLAFHNIIDNVGGANKSVFHGLDADFNVNVLVTTLGIQGPSVSRNLAMGVYDIGTKQEKKLKNRERRNKIIGLQKELEELKLAPAFTGQQSVIESIESNINNLIEEASLSFTFDMAEVAQMEDEELRQLFDLDTQLKELDQDAAIYGAEMARLGNPEFYKAKLEEVKQKKKRILEQMDALRNAPDKRRAEELKEYLGTSEYDASVSFYYNYYHSTLKLADAMGQKYRKFKDQESMDEFLNEELELGNISIDEVESLQAGFNERFAMGNESSLGIIIREDNVAFNLENASTDFERSIAAFTLFHEMQHQNDKSIGLLENFSKENDVVVQEVEKFIEDQYKNNPKFTKEVYNTFLGRFNKYKENGTHINELTALLAELQNYGAIENNTSLEVSVRVLLNTAMKNYFGEMANMFRFRDARDVSAYVANFRKGVRNYVAAGTVPEDESTKAFSESIDLAMPVLIDMLENGSAIEKSYAGGEIKKQFDNLALAALGFDPKVKIAQRDEVLAEARKFLPSILERFNPEVSKFSTFVFANMAPKKAQIYEIAKVKERTDTKSLDAPESMEVAGDVNQTTNVEDTFVQKIDTLLDFSIISTVANKIKSLVKTKEGDTFKQVIKNYAGKVGELIFGIPAKKIMEGDANLTAVTKYEEGMPIPAEGQSIQRVFSAGENMSKFIKTLPLLNVARKTADINKVGENIDVSREVYGRAIGLKGRVQDYFYENYTDPKATSTDQLVKKEAETSPGGRSLGLTSQTGVKILKPEFRALTDETIEKVKQDFGITPKGEPNVYSRDIGQLLKAAAKALSIGAALSGAQRVQEVKLKKAPPKKKKAIKQQTANITSAQGRSAFSESLVSVDNMIKVMDFLELETKGIDGVLNSVGKKATYDLSTVLTEEGRDEFFKILKEDLFPHMPKEFFFTINKNGKVTSDAFTVSHKNYWGDVKFSMSETKKGSGMYKNPEERNAYNTFRDELRKLALDPSVKFAPSIEGANFDVIKSYQTMFGTQEKRNDKKAIDQWNEDVGFIHRKMWESFNKAMQNDKDGKVTRAIGTYLKLTANDKKSWHRLGAQVLGFTKNLKGKKIEMEHAMPATQAYLYLIKSSLSLNPLVDFKSAYDLIIENYKLIVLDKTMDNKLTKARTARGYSLRFRMPDNWSVVSGSWWQRYFNELVVATDGIGIDPNSIVGLDGKTTFATMFNINASGLVKNMDVDINNRNNFSEAIISARGYNKNTKATGMSTFDFDETLIIDGKNFIMAIDPVTGEKTKIVSAEWPIKGPKLQEQGFKFDFKDFVNVRGGTEGPLLQKMKNQIRKYGSSNVFVLTARMQESDIAIHGWLKTQGINIPIKNITGLGKSTGEAKALWMLNKFAEGYNDMYFVDDALPNVKAVKNVLEQLDIKSKVVQAKMNFSEGLDLDFNKILEEVTGIDAKKRFSAIKARKRGNSKGKFRFFIPPSHEDLVGLLYNFIGKGKIGDAHRDFFEQALVRPLNRAYRELNTAKQSIANDYKSLNKKFKDIKKKLTKKTPDGDFTYQDAIRIYLWDKHGYKIPGLSETDQQNLVDLIKNDSELKTYAEALNVISQQEAYVKPTENWETGDIRVDLDDATGRVGREQFFAEFFENADVIFSDENFNKIEAAFGAGVVSAFKDILYRTRTGRNRPSGQNEQVNKWMNYLNGSVAATMFFNIRSAVLQQMSMVNFINFADNNMFAAAKAFVNRKQYWSDWATIFNSDFMKQRRGGIKTDINGADLAASLRGAKNTPRALLAKLLELGFLPTQIGDNIAIATGGSTFYRNRINTYLKQGLNKKEAEAKAWIDFQVLAEATQQSARPDMVSQQQASALGKIILAFQNVTSQFNRIGKKAFLDIKNKRITPGNTTLFQSNVSNLSRIAYYFAIQNLIFYSLQTALFAAMFDDDEDDERLLKKKERILNGTIDSILRGAGVWGAVVATIKNMAIASHREREKDWNGDESSVLVEALNLSPPLGIKARKLVNAEKTLNYNKKVIKIMETFDIDNPMWSAYTSRIEAVTNIPLNRLYNKTQNIRQALNNQNSAYQRALMFMGWSQYNLGIENQKMDDIKNKSKKKKRKILI